MDTRGPARGRAVVRLSLVFVLVFALSGISGATGALAAPSPVSGASRSAPEIEDSPLFAASLEKTVEKLDQDGEASPGGAIEWGDGRVSVSTDDEPVTGSYVPLYTTSYTCYTTCGTTCGSTCFGTSTCIGSTTCAGTYTCASTCNVTCGTTCTGNPTCSSTCAGNPTCYSTCSGTTCTSTCGSTTCSTTCGTTCTATCGTTCTATCGTTCEYTCAVGCEPYEPLDPIEPVLFEDGLETFPGVWTVGGSAGPQWGQTTYRKTEGSYSAYCAGSTISAPGPYANDMYTYMYAGPFDLSAETSAKIRFDLWMDTEQDWDKLHIGASTDGSLFDLGWTSGATGGWVPAAFDLTDPFGDGSVSYVGEPEVWIMFGFESDESVTREGVYVDNVRLVGTPVDRVVPIAGSSRYETAVLASQEAYPDGLAESGAKTVVVATGRNWPDALGGSALAGAIDGPILLVTGTSVPEIVLDEIGRLGAERAIIVGGEFAVAPSVHTALTSALGAGRVTRVAGTNRYTTADAVAVRTVAELNSRGGYDGTAFVATGSSYADAVAAAPLAANRGWPLFLASPTSGLRDSTMAAMAPVSQVLVLGGTTAVSADTFNSLRSVFGTGNVERLADTTRYGTAAVIAGYGVNTAGLSWNRVGIATGQAYPDALAGGVLQGKAGSVMLLTRSTSLSPEPAAAIEANKGAITTVTYFGGYLAVAQAVRNSVEQILE